MTCTFPVRHVQQPRGCAVSDWLTFANVQEELFNALVLLCRCLNVHSTNGGSIPRRGDMLTCAHTHHTTPHTRVRKDTQQCDIVGSVDTTNLCKVKDCVYTQIASNPPPPPLPSSKSLCSLSRIVKGYSSTLHFRHKTHYVPYY